MFAIVIILQSCQLPRFKALWPETRHPTTSTCPPSSPSLTAAAMPLGKPHCSVYRIVSPTFYPRESPPRPSKPQRLSSVVAHFACRQYLTAAKQNAGCVPFVTEDVARFVLMIMEELLFAAPILALLFTSSRGGSCRFKCFLWNASA